MPLLEWLERLIGWKSGWDGENYASQSGGRAKVGANTNKGAAVVQVNFSLLVFFTLPPPYLVFPLFDVFAVGYIWIHDIILRFSKDVQHILRPSTFQVLSVCVAHNERYILNAMSISQILSPYAFLWQTNGWIALAISVAMAFGCLRSQSDWRSKAQSDFMLIYCKPRMGETLRESTCITPLFCGNCLRNLSPYYCAV